MRPALAIAALLVAAAPMSSLAHGDANWKLSLGSEIKTRLMAFAGQRWLMSTASQEQVISLAIEMHGK